MSKHFSLTDDYLNELESNLLLLNDCQLECDGMTYAISYVLNEAGIAHERMIGYAQRTANGQVVHPHCWIALDADTVIDFRLRMWLGDDDQIPHGIFRPSEQNIHYVGQLQDRPLPTKSVIDLLTGFRLDKVAVSCNLG